eukprot:SAG31_NODE_564_length_14059_cov_5.728940_6_plen_89_part_00
MPRYEYPEVHHSEVPEGTSILIFCEPAAAGGACRAPLHTAVCTAVLNFKNVVHVHACTMCLHGGYATPWATRSKFKRTKFSSRAPDLR